MTLEVEGTDVILIATGSEVDDDREGGGRS